MVYKATYNWRAPSCSGSTDPSSLKKKAASHTHGPCHHPGVLCRQVQGVQLPFSVRLGGELRSAEKPTRGWLKSHPLMWIWGTFVDGFTWVYHGQITEIELFMTRSSDLYSRFIFFSVRYGAAECSDTWSSETTNIYLFHEMQNKHNQNTLHYNPSKIPTWGAVTNPMLRTSPKSGFKKKNSFQVCRVSS